MKKIQALREEMDERTWRKELSSKLVISGWLIQTISTKDGTLISIPHVNNKPYPMAGLGPDYYKVYRNNKLIWICPKWNIERLYNLFAIEVGMKPLFSFNYWNNFTVSRKMKGNGIHE